MSPEQKANNLEIALASLKEVGVNCRNPNPTIFMSGKHKNQVLDFIWEIILAFHKKGTIGQQVTSEAIFKQALLERCQNAIGASQGRIVKY